jgi:hypothetical protein
VKRPPPSILSAARRREGIALPDPNELIVEEKSDEGAPPAGFELQVEEPGAPMEDAEEILIVDEDNPAGGAKKSGPK